MRRQKRKMRGVYRSAGKIRMIAFDFDGVFTDNRVLVLQNGREGVFCFRGDGVGLTGVKNSGIAVVVISAEVNPIVGVRCRKLGLRYIQGCKDKLKILKQEAARLNIALKEVAYVGNDVPDIGCLREVGLPMCVADSHPRVFAFAKYITDLPGGNGAIRECCDLILKVKNGTVS